VEFYNHVHGLVPTARLVKKGLLQEGQAPSSAFRAGQPVKVRVRRVDVGQAKINATADLAPAGAAAGVGRVSAGVVEAASADGQSVAVRLADGESGLLSAQQLSDHPSLASKLLALLQPGAALEQVLVLRHDAAASPPLVLSVKPALVAASLAGQLPQTLSELAVGQLLAAHVKRTQPFGVFVEFAGGLTALAPKAQLSDLFVSDPAQLFEVGQTVLAKVLSVDEAKQQAVVSLKPSDCAATPEQQAQLVSSYFADAARVAPQTSGSASLVGAVLKATVRRADERGGPWWTMHDA
jgi:rRNA biogenesis protein RRP5